MYETLSRYYDLFLDDSLYDHYLDLIQQHHQEGTVLDLGCGTAPLTIKLAKAGYFVSGTDISHSMLEEAYNNAVQNDLHIRFFLHDLKDPITNTYDIYTMASDVINYVLEETDILTIFQNISAVLDDNAIFVFDFYRPTFLKEIDGYKETIPLEDDTLVWQVEQTNVPHQIKHTLAFKDITETHIQKTFPLKRYTHLLKEANMYVVTKKKTKERIILLCKKL